MKFLPYILRSLWRHRARTLLTVSGSAVALFVFCFVAAVQEGMDSLLRGAAAEQALVVFQANKFCPATSHLPQDYQRSIEELDSVRRVVPVQVFTNNCRASLDVVVFYGLPPGALREVRDLELVAGNWAEFTQRRDAAVVGRSVAERRGLRAGDTFSLGDLTVRIAGVFRSDDPSTESHVYAHLEFLQRRKSSRQVGTVTQFEVLLEPEVELSAACEQIDALFRQGPVPTATRPKGVFQSSSLGDLAQLIGLARYLGYACLGLVLALVATTTVMSIQDRRQEHAVLQTLGFSGPRVFRLVLTESTLLGLGGGVAGVAAALLVLHVSSLSIGAEAVTIAFTPSLRLAVIGLGVSLLTGIAAGLAPAWYAARNEIVPALRHR
jgi:putative ABC transport system permease protein